MKVDKKKCIQYCGICLLVIVIACLIFVISRVLFNRWIDKKVEDIDWVRGNVNIILDSSMGENIYSVDKNKYISIYNMKYQQVISEKIDTLLEDVDDDIIIYNPYGTNILSVNVYLKDSVDSKLKYVIESDDEDIDNFSRTLVDNEGGQYQLTGLIPGMLNNVIIKTEDGDEVLSFKVDMSNISINSEVTIETEDGSSKQELADGLYALLGNDSDSDDYISLYDNDGVIRGEIPIIGYRAHSILFKDNKMYFSISQTRIAAINNLGEVERIYRTGNYQLHHDYVFDDDGNLLVLANNTEKDTEEDCIIKIDLDTSKVSEVIDFEDIFSSYVETCVLDTVSVRDEGEDGLDWLHLNSIEFVDGDVFLSSRETSSIMKVSDIYGKAKLEYILSNEKFWEDTEFSEYLYTKVGDFKIHAGQHSVRYSEAYEDGVYYLTFYNNNYGKSNSKPSFDYSEVGITNNNAFEGDNSYYYVYKVNENEKTFELIDDIEVDYSGIVSSVQNLDNDNIVIDSGTKGTFYEYDKNHELIKKYTVKLNKYMVYRVFKYDFNGFWFDK